MRCFPCPVASRKSSLFDCCSKGKTPAEIARETGTEAIDTVTEQRFTEHTGRRRLRAPRTRGVVAGEGDTVGPVLPQRLTDDMLASARTRRLFRYLLTLFFILLAAGPLVMADSDLGSVLRMQSPFLLQAIHWVLGCFCRCAARVENRSAGTIRMERMGRSGSGSPCVWAITVCCGVVFCLYRGMEVHTRSRLIAAPVLFCGIASMASLAVKLRPFKVHAHTRAITLLGIDRL